MYPNARQTEILSFYTAREELKCPKCGSPDLTRCPRRGLWEWISYKFLKMRPYHCIDCGFRFII